MIAVMATSLNLDLENDVEDNLDINVDVDVNNNDDISGDDQGCASCDGGCGGPCGNGLPTTNIQNITNVNIKFNIDIEEESAPAFVDPCLNVVCGDGE